MVVCNVVRNVVCDVFCLVSVVMCRACLMSIQPTCLLLLTLSYIHPSCTPQLFCTPHHPSTHATHTLSLSLAVSHTPDFIRRAFLPSLSLPEGLDHEAISVCVCVCVCACACVCVRAPVCVCIHKRARARESSSEREEREREREREGE